MDDCRKKMPWKPTGFLRFNRLPDKDTLETPQEYFLRQQVCREVAHGYPVVAEQSDMDSPSRYFLAAARKFLGPQLAVSPTGETSLRCSNPSPAINCLRQFIAGLGFEPRYTPPEGVVLPLDDPAFRHIMPEVADIGKAWYSIDGNNRWRTAMKSWATYVDEHYNTEGWEMRIAALAGAVWVVSMIATASLGIDGGHPNATRWFSYAFFLSSIVHILAGGLRPTIEYLRERRSAPA